MTEVAIFSHTGLHSDGHNAFPHLVGSRSSSSISSSGQDELSDPPTKKQQQDLVDDRPHEENNSIQSDASSSSIDTFSMSSSSSNDLPEVVAVPEANDRSTDMVVAEVDDIVPIDNVEDTRSSLCDTSADAPKQAASQCQQQRPPAVRSVVIRKRSHDDLLGLSFVRDDVGRLQIFKVNPKGILSNSPLLPRDNVLSINNDLSCTYWSPEQAIQYLKGIVGLISIVVSSSTTDDEVDESVKQAMAFKDTPRDKLGISFKTEHGRLRIGSINYRDKGALLAAGSSLEVGDYVLSINGIQSSELDPQLARDIVASAPDVVTLDVADRKFTTELSATTVDPSTSPSEELPGCYSPETPILASEVTADADGDTSVDEHFDSTAPAIISVKVVKPDRHAPLGIQLGTSSNGVISIRKIAPGSILDSTPLREGFSLLSINHNSCRKSELKDVLSYLRDAEGELLLVSRNPKGNPNFVQAMATKALLDHPQARVGISFSISPGGTELHVGSIRDTSLFVNSVLNKGDIAVEINGIPCRHLTPSDAVDVVKQSSRYISITAEAGRMSGIVISQGPDSI